MRPIRVGVVGAGEMVTKAHLPVLLAMNDVRVEWILDVDRDRTVAASQAFGIRPVHPDDASSQLAADVVLIGIPYGVRGPYYDRFANRALYVEKPFARTVDEHMALCSRFPEHRLACGLQRRMWGPTQMVRRIVSEQLFGSLRTVRFGYGRPVITVGSGYSSNIALAGGGMVLESGIHGVDTVLFCTGAVSAEFTRARMIMEDGFDIHTEADLVLTSADGRPFDCQLEFTCLRTSICRLDFVFDFAAVSLDLFGEAKVIVRPSSGGTEYNLLPEAGAFFPSTTPETLLQTWRTFLDGVRDERPNPTNAARSILTTRVIEGLYAAAEPAGHELRS